MRSLGAEIGENRGERVEKPTNSGFDLVLWFVGYGLAAWGVISLFAGPFTSGRLAISVLLFVAGVIVNRYAERDRSGENNRAKPEDKV